ncbi:site-specific integrase [Ruegeria pomeroyi]|uniref:Site-specific integrase n=1 Tax=Ruegeria pomeroyi TaxID=89184 RepID=A0A9Q3ZS53_9RHOB|nr:site-specific integrase [Ruegeria pomeroyi]MCE8539717.1 site-specific integrase [Ruegeria pomeroyi]
MSSPFSITKRKNSNNFYVRYYVPETHRAALGGKDEIWRSLRTSDLQVAKTRSITVAATIWNEILDAQHSTFDPAAPPPPEPTHAELEEAARYVYAAEVESDQEERADPANVALMDMGGKNEAKQWKREAKRLSNAIAKADFSFTNHEYWCDYFGFHFVPDSPKEQAFRQLLARAYLEAAQRFAEHAKGRFNGSPGDTTLFRPLAPAYVAPVAPPAPPAPVAPARQFNEPPLLDLWDRYVTQRCASIKPETVANRLQTVTMFANYVGFNRPADSITKVECRAFRDLLHELPKSASKLGKFKGMTVKQIVQANKALGLPTVSANTVKHLISDLSGFFGWLATEDVIEDNFWRGLAPEVIEDQRPPFAIDQLKTFFASPLFTGCERDGTIGKVTTSGAVLIRDWRFWLPLIAAFSGARQGEIAQLDTSDLRTVDGILCMEITNRGVDPTKSVKTRAAVRLIPVHTTLIALGLQDLAQRQHRSGHTRLFPELVRNRAGQFDKASKFYARYINRMNFTPDEAGKTPSFHSFRHTVIDAFRRADLTEAEFQPLVGHEHKSVTRGYGREATYGVAKRKEIIEKIEYPGLDLSALAVD